MRQNLQHQELAADPQVPEPFQDHGSPGRRDERGRGHDQREPSGPDPHHPRPQHLAVDPTNRTFRNVVSVLTHRTIEYEQNMLQHETEHTCECSALQLVHISFNNLNCVYVKYGIMHHGVGFLIVLR